MNRDTLARLKRQLKNLGVTHDHVAAEAKVGRTLVVHVLAGRAKSANVVATARRLIAEAKSTATPSQHPERGRTIRPAPRQSRPVAPVGGQENGHPARGSAGRN